MSKILAVVVTYHPKIAQLERLLALLMPQVQESIIIDNSATTILTDWFNQQIHQYNAVKLINPSKNLGLGAAHNLGIQYAKQYDYDFVLQFDQDSLPHPDMVAQLITAYQQLFAQGHKVAAVGPNWVDKEHGSKATYLQYNGYRVSRRQCPIDKNGAFIAADYLITSGCLIPVHVLEDVGNLNEALFIDFVDIEWGLRAKSKGYQCFGVCSAVLIHELGDETVKFLGRKFHSHSPLRHYYIIRNATILLKRDYLSRGWKLNALKSLVLQLGIYPLVFKPRLQHLKMMLIGLWHGIRGLSGFYYNKN